MILHPPKQRRSYPDNLHITVTILGLESESPHRLSETAYRLFPAPARRAVENDRDLLDADFFDALDLRVALGNRAGDGELVDQPIDKHLGLWPPYSS